MASHPIDDEMMAGIQRMKAARLKKEADDHIKDVQKFLGENPNKRCKHCKRQSVIVGHADGCLLTRLNLESLKQVQKDVAIKLRKDINKQRIFRSDKPRWSGMPPMQKTLVRKRTSKNRGPAREVKKCRVCGEQTLFMNTTGEWMCSKCSHSKPCSWEPLGRNCGKCFPNRRLPKKKKTETK